MIVFVQPFGLASPGGGPRILRALLAAVPEPWTSVCASPTPPPPADHLGREIHLPIRPSLGARIERTRIGHWLGQLLPLFEGRFEARLEGLCRELGARAIHAIPHGTDFWRAFQVARRLGLRYVLSVHDDLAYNLSGRPELARAQDYLSRVWPEADARTVIGEAMGRECCRRWGERPFEVVTDGLERVPDAPASRPAGSLRVYFGGALHLSYRDNFRCLVEALAILSREHPPGAVRLVTRGSPSPASHPAVPATFLPWGSEAEVARDLDEADLLYLPLPFDPRHDPFVRWSLPTKLVTYAGSDLPILYHGPAHSAAAALLEGAAIHVTSLAPETLAAAIRDAAGRAAPLVERALALGRRQFMLEDQRRRFWAALGPARAAD